MMGERSLVSLDWAMKKLLRSKANVEILEGFLTELLAKTSPSWKSSSRRGIATPGGMQVMDFLLQTA